MISKPLLRDLVKQRVKDARALFEKRRYYASIYMSGYAIEMALKYKICRMYFFSKGFPENNSELQQYYKQIKNKRVRSIIYKIHEIKHHDLSKLLVYSGEEYNIKKNHFTEWMTVLKWNPEMRYKYSKIRKAVAKDNFDSIVILLKSIL